MSEIKFDFADQNRKQNQDPGRSRSSSQVKSEKSRIEREKRLVEAKAVFLSDIVPNWPKSRSYRKCKSLFLEGLPPAVRGIMWKTIIGNDLNITPELYEILLQRAAEMQRQQQQIQQLRLLLLQQQQQQQQQSPPEERKDDQSSTDPIAILSSLGQSSNSKEHTLQDIEQDIPRTFAELSFFQRDEGPLYQPLFDVLRAYASLRPDIGYCQGMSYVAAMLLLNLDTAFDAFVAFANLLNQQFQLTFFRFDIKLMEDHLRIFSALLDESIPQLGQHLRQEQVLPSTYIYDWLLTLYSKSLPLDVASRLWDIYLYHVSEPSSAPPTPASPTHTSQAPTVHCTLATIFLFRTALGILKLYENQLLNQPMEACLELLTRLPQDIAEREEELFGYIEAFDISEKKFNKLVLSIVPES